MLISFVSIVSAEDSIYSIYRSGGFRRVTDFTDENDYGFQINKELQWEFNLHRSGCRSFGTLAKEELTKLKELVSNAFSADEKSQVDPRIADLPEMSVTKEDDSENRIRLRVDSDQAKAIDDWLRKTRAIKNEQTVSHLRFKAVGRRGRFDEPKVLEGKDELKEAFNEEVAKSLVDVDFEKQKLLVFQWAGSGQDRLEAKLDRSKEPSVLNVKYFPGRTRDLRGHLHIFVVPIVQKFEVKR